MEHRTQRSAALFEAAKKRMPGGVNSPVRAFRAVGGVPLFISRAEGAYLFDEDGHQYVDYMCTWGPAILGHAHPGVVKAVQAAVERGASFGAPTAAEVDMAETVHALMPSMEMVRMVSSGTEACMSAIRLARGFTGRDGVVKFEGCYHGHVDSLLVKAGSGGATFGTPDSAGVPQSFAQHTYTIPYNDVNALEALFAERGDQISSVIVEPVTGNMGVILPSAAFLNAMQALTRAHGALLIFDEVMTGFRVELGGAQARFGVKPDLTCLGKVVGGGLPVGVYGGRAEVMNHISPLGPVYQAGTLSGNPLATAAGLATLKELSAPGVFAEVESNASALELGLKELIARLGVEAVVQRAGTMLTLFFASELPQNFDEVSACDHQRFARFHQAMLAEGVYLPPSGYEAWFLSLAHKEAQVAATLAAAEKALQA